MGQRSGGPLSRDRCLTIAFKDLKPNVTIIHGIFMIITQATATDTYTPSVCLSSIKVFTVVSYTLVLHAVYWRLDTEMDTRQASSVKRLHLLNQLSLL